MQLNHLETPMQKAFRELGLVTSSKPKLTPVTNVSVSYKTAQALKKQGVLA